MPWYKKHEVDDTLPKHVEAYDYLANTGVRLPASPLSFVILECMRGVCPH